MVASTVHVMPPRDADSDDPDSVHSPVVTDHETEPVDCPPVVDKASEPPVVNDVPPAMAKPDCEALPMVMDVSAEFFAL